MLFESTCSHLLIELRLQRLHFQQQRICAVAVQAGGLGRLRATRRVPDDELLDALAVLYLLLILRGTKEASGWDEGRGVGKGE